MELTEREKLIIKFYEDGKIPTMIAIYDILKKERKKTNAIRYISKLVRTRNNKLSYSSNSNSWFNTINKKINNERLENE